MTLLIWISLVVAVVAVVGGLALAGLRALAAWRAFKLLRSRVGDALADNVRRLGEMEKRLAHAGETAARLDEARRRLQAGLAVAALLTGATGDTRAVLKGIRGIIPRK